MRYSRTGELVDIPFVYGRPPRIRRQCPECGGHFALNRDGRLRPHGHRIVGGWLFVCKGEWPS